MNSKDLEEKRKGSRTKLFLNKDKAKKVENLISKLTKNKRTGDNNDVDTEPIDLTAETTDCNEMMDSESDNIATLRGNVIRPENIPVEGGNVLRLDNFALRGNVVRYDNIPVVSTMSLYKLHLYSYYES